MMHLFTLIPYRPFSQNNSTNDVYTYIRNKSYSPPSIMTSSNHCCYRRLGSSAFVGVASLTDHQIRQIRS